jgi:sporulation protein YlmC with PRC-barrel domain
MQLSKLLGLRVVDAASHHLGTVIDVRLAIAGDPSHNPSRPRMVGLVISPRSRSSFLGYERSGATQPKVLAVLLRWRHRGTFLAAWEDIERFGSDAVRLRRDYTRYSALLREGV